jgi:hypothetical protein
MAYVFFANCLTKILTGGFFGTKIESVCKYSERPRGPDNVGTDLDIQAL